MSQHSRNVDDVKPCFTQQTQPIAGIHIADFWIPVQIGKPNPDQVVQAWDEEKNGPENAFFDPSEECWYNQYDGSPLEAVSHWRVGSRPDFRGGR